MTFTLKQRRAYTALCDPDKTYYLFDGSSRCGKTWLILQYICDYCLKYKGARVLIGRYYFRVARKTLWQHTLLPILQERFKGMYSENKSDHVITFAWGSQIHLGGFDSGDQLDKIMGTEWPLIYINELIEDPYETWQTLKTRLNHKDFPLKFIGDCNPKSPSHWVHRQFISLINPESRLPLSDKEKSDQCRIWWHVRDNKENLSDKYIEILNTMTGVKGKRLRDGVWCESVDGTVYEFNRNKNLINNPIEPVNELEKWCGWDFGIAADTALIFFQIQYFHPTKDNPLGIVISIFDEYCNNNKDYKYYADVVKAKGYMDLQHAGDPAGVARDAQLKSWFSLLAEEGIHLQRKKKLTVADMVYNANQYMPYIRVNEAQCPYTVEMFENWSYKKDRDGRVIENSLPEHNEYSHIGTALYYAISNALPINKGYEQIQIY